MTLEYFKPYKPQSDAADIIEHANRIINEYSEEGYDLTLRQLYYQFVQESLIANNMHSYNKLGNVINRGRMAGMISWTSIIDRHRKVNLARKTMDSVSEAINSARWFIECNHWDKQKAYVEVWVEKDALGAVISKACKQYNIPHLACKGYLSTSVLWNAGKRFHKAIEEKKQCVVIHLGDHDASGLDMTRDNKERVNMFANYGFDDDFVEMRRIALNMDQIEKYAPPPNPVKKSDSRSPEYIKEYGNESWELDALRPQTISDLINNEVESIIDLDIWGKANAHEHALRKEVDALAKKVRK